MILHVHEKKTNNFQCEEMSCLLCRKYPKVADHTGSFFLGMQSFRLQNIQVRGKSQGHWKCFEADKAAKNPDAGILQNIRNMNEQLQEKMLKLYFICLYQMFWATKILPRATRL